jgi:hypothetical protein
MSSNRKGISIVSIIIILAIGLFLGFFFANLRIDDIETLKDCRDFPKLVDKIMDDDIIGYEVERGKISIGTFTSGQSMDKLKACTDTIKELDIDNIINKIVYGILY